MSRPTSQAQLLNFMLTVPRHCLHGPKAWVCALIAKAISSNPNAVGTLLSTAERDSYVRIERGKRRGEPFTYTLTPKGAERAGHLVALVPAGAPTYADVITQVSPPSAAIPMAARENEATRLRARLLKFMLTAPEHTLYGSEPWVVSLVMEALARGADCVRQLLYEMEETVYLYVEHDANATTVLYRLTRAGIAAAKALEPVAEDGELEYAVALSVVGPWQRQPSACRPARMGRSRGSASDSWIFAVLLSAPGYHMPFSRALFAEMLAAVSGIKTATLIPRLAKLVEDGYLNESREARQVMNCTLTDKGQRYGRQLLRAVTEPRPTYAELLARVGKVVQGESPALPASSGQDASVDAGVCGEPAIDAKGAGAEEVEVDPLGGEELDLDLLSDADRSPSNGSSGSSRRPKSRGLDWLSGRDIEARVQARIEKRRQEAMAADSPKPKAK